MLGQQPSVTSILGTDLGSGRLVTSQFQDVKARCRTVGAAADGSRKVVEEATELRPGIEDPGV